MLFVLMVIVIPLLDQVTKSLVIKGIPLYETVPLIPGLVSFTHLHNPGAAFGILSQGRYLFIGVAVALVGAAFFYRHRIMAEPRGVQLALGLGLGGAIGNVIDRVLLGYVTDFIQVPIIPVFNVADMAITFAVVILFYHSFVARPAVRVHSEGDMPGDDPIER